jgi:formiminotetrahydrofolate cyclodeaminase
MTWAKTTLEDFENAIKSSDPTPGGGTVAAVALGQAAALVSMVAELTLSSERWSDAHEEAKEALSHAAAVMPRASHLADEDAAAFDAVVEAFKLPKSNDEEKDVRRQAIRDATLGAAIVPFETAEHACALLPHVLAMAERGNSNAASDAGVASLMATAAAKGAVFNVIINLNSLPETMGLEMRQALPAMEENIRLLGRKCMDAVRGRL